MRKSVWIGLVLAVALGVVWLGRGAVRFEAELPQLSDDLEDEIHAREGAYRFAHPALAEQIVWAGDKGARTDIAVVYLHGFSASPAETRPLPDLVARSLGANLYFARLNGHGLDGKALADARPEDWAADTARALAMGQALGRRVVVIGTSTGGTFAALAALSPQLREMMDAVVLISPNFRISAPASRLLTLPFARLWVPLVAGRERCFDVRSDAHALFWTSCYPTRALFGMAALVAYARGQSYAGVDLPALFIHAAEDKVVDPHETARVAAEWGSAVGRPAEMRNPRLTAGADPHVIAGEILSPDMSAPLADETVIWLRDVLNLPQGR